MTSPYERLLLATEHTDFDVGAERIALALAAAWPVALTAVMPLASNAEYEAVAPDVVARAEADMHARMVALRGDAARVDVDLAIRIRRGPELWGEIVDEARRTGSDLIVLRRRGKRSFLAELMIGETVDAVVRAAPCDVLMVPRAASLWSQRVLAAVDATPAAPAVARAASRLAMAAALPLTLVTVAKPGERADGEATVARAVAVAHGEGAKAEGRVAEGQTAEAIVGLARQSGADLIVVGRSTPRPLHFGSTAQRVVGLATCAVLAVKP